MNNVFIWQILAALFETFHTFKIVTMLKNEMFTIIYKNIYNYSRQNNTRNIFFIPAITAIGERIKL